MFLPNKTIKNKKFNYLQNKMSIKKTTQYNKFNYPQKKMLALHMVLKPFARDPKQPMVLF